MRTPLVRRPPPGLASKVSRAVWGLVWLIFYRPTPRPFHAWRRALLRLFGAQVARDAMPYPDAHIWAPWNLAMGPQSVMGDGVQCYNVDRVTLAAGAVVSQRSHLCTASRDLNDAAKPLVTAPIVIGPKAWVATEAYIGPGVTLAEGAVAAARAVVVRNVDEWSIVGGNPARPIGARRQVRDQDSDGRKPDDVS